MRPKEGLDTLDMTEVSWAVPLGSVLEIEHASPWHGLERNDTLFTNREKGAHKTIYTHVTIEEAARPSRGPLWATAMKWKHTYQGCPTK